MSISKLKLKRGEKVKRVLITGTSGFLGTNVAEDLKSRGYEVLSISRKAVSANVDFHVQGDFDDFQALEKFELDGSETLIHLAAVTGDANEEDAMRVNVYQSSRLIRFCVERGIKRLVLASSIAVVGCLTKDFMPRTLPIPDEHSCDSSNVYGLSKYMMEEYARYVKRNHQDLEITLFRIGVVLKREAISPGIERIADMWRPFCTLGCVHVDDVVGAFRHAIERDFEPRFGIYNLVASDSFSTLPTADALRVALGQRAEQLDLTAYATNDSKHSGLYDIRRLVNEFGYTPKIKVSKLNLN